MRYTGNSAKVMLAAAMTLAASVGNRQEYVWLSRQYQRFHARETQRFARMKRDPIGAAERSNHATDRRQRRAAKRYQNHLRCIDNNPCLRSAR